METVAVGYVEWNTCNVPCNNCYENSFCRKLLWGLSNRILESGNSIKQIFFCFHSDGQQMTKNAE